MVTFNRCCLLKKCIDALLNQSYPIHGIVLIDNGSTDETKNLIHNYIANGAPVTYFNTGKNIGSSGGFNIGIEMALQRESEWIWAMDDDVMPDKTCLEELVLNANNFDVIQPYRYYAENNFVKSECRKFNFSNPFLELKMEYITNPSESGHSEIACFPFEGPLIKREIVLKSGLPSKDYFIIADDTEYSLRLAKSGGRFKMCPSALMQRQIKPQKSSRLNWKSYFTIRNNIFNDKIKTNLAFSTTRALITAVKMLLASIYRRRNLIEYTLIIQSTIDGVCGKLEDPNVIIKKYSTPKE